MALVFHVFRTCITTINNSHDNPLRYRGYYFDNESGYYYLQSRYYDSNTCRFINADESSILELTKGQAVGYNLFAYCGNDPVNNVDPSGKLFSGLTFAIKIARLFIKQPIVKRIKTDPEKKDFARAIYTRAKLDYPLTRIPPEIMTGQACLESGYGTSPAAVNKYNLFGIMPGGKIAKYSSIEASILKYEHVLTLSYYKNLYKLKSVYDWAMKIGPAGYCQEKDYGKNLWATITKLKNWGVFR